MRRKLEVWVLVVYTLINLKFLWPFIAQSDLVVAAALKDSAMTSFLALFVGLFLNAALIIYFLERHNGHAT